MFEPPWIAATLFAALTIYHALAWRILLAGGRRTPDGLFAVLTVFSAGLLSCVAASSYFPFHSPFFFVILIALQGIFLGYIYAFPNALRPPLRWAALVISADALLVAFFLSDTRHAAMATALATSFFLAVAIFLILRKQRHLASDLRATANCSLAVTALTPFALGIGATVSLLLLRTGPFTAATLLMLAALALMLALAHRVSRDIPLTTPLVLILCALSVPCAFLWVGLFPLRVLIARNFATDAFFVPAATAAFLFVNIFAIFLLWLAGRIYHFALLRQAHLERLVAAFRSRASNATTHRDLLNAFDAALRQAVPDNAAIRYVLFSEDDERLAELGHERTIDPALEKGILTEWFLEGEEPYLLARTAPSGLLESACARIGADLVLPLRDKGMLFGLILVRAPKVTVGSARAAAEMLSAASDHYLRLSLIRLIVQKERLLRETQYFAETDKMVSVIAHEVRTPLTAVMFNLDVLAEALRKGKACDAEYLDIARSEMRRLNETVEKMLLFGRDIKLEPAEGSFGSFVAELSRTFASSTLPVRFAFPEKGRFRLDWDRLRHILINLVNNALQAIEATGAPGSVTVTIAEQGSSLTITVSDDGPGIPDDIRERIFDPFFTTRRDGNGLGLAICRKIARLMGGTLELTTSMPGRTVFMLSVPQPST